jgi:hypothetical protein
MKRMLRWCLGPLLVGVVSLAAVTQVHANKNPGDFLCWNIQETPTWDPWGPNCFSADSSGNPAGWYGDLLISSHDNDAGSHITFTVANGPGPEGEKCRGTVKCTAGFYQDPVVRGVGTWEFDIPVVPAEVMIYCTCN